jgi:hypothetical protein
VKQEKNYYLIGLLAFGALFIGGLVYMLKIAFSTPVEMDNSHMMTYGELDKKYNEIAALQREFDEKYLLVTPKVALMKDVPANLELNITDKTGRTVDANITAVITRPDTSKYDITINEFTKNAGSYISKQFSVPLEGRWKVMYRVQVGNLQKFTDFETFANKTK